MEINMKEFKKWIAALDSGKYQQTSIGLLHNCGRYCCLGVACKVLIPEDRLKFDHGRIVGGLPDTQDNAPEWLKKINEDFQNKTGRALSMLNDSDRMTFTEIATLLELVYVHKILDEQ